METTMTMQPEAVPVIKSCLDMKRKALEHNLRRYKDRLAAFEEQFHMTSEQFGARFNSGELGDAADWFEWDFVLGAYRETAQQLDVLASVRL